MRQMLLSKDRAKTAGRKLGIPINREYRSEEAFSRLVLAIQCGQALGRIRYKRIAGAFFLYGEKCLI